jgi:hypothetical protein
MAVLQQHYKTKEFTGVHVDTEPLLYQCSIGMIKDCTNVECGCLSSKPTFIARALAHSMHDLNSDCQHVCLLTHNSSFHPINITTFHMFKSMVSAELPYMLPDAYQYLTITRRHPEML